MKSVVGVAALERRKFALSVGPRPSRVLEIGAFDNPIFHRALGDNVQYLDWFSRAELIEMHKNNPRRRLERAVDVDYVVKTAQFASIVPGKFDLICASEVIEHIPDVVAWLNQLETLLSDHGRIFLVVPDKRFTFDYYRPLSDAFEMIRAHRERLTKPSLWQLASHFYYHFKVDAKALWKGQKPSKFVPRFSFEAALKMAEEKAQHYTDAHCWTFTASSFVRVIRNLNSVGLISVKAVHVQPPQKGKATFLAILSRNGLEQKKDPTSETKG